MMRNRRAYPQKDGRTSGNFIRPFRMCRFSAAAHLLLVGCVLVLVFCSSNPDMSVTQTGNPVKVSLAYRVDPARAVDVTGVTRPGRSM
ncbi:MAG: hypothetical protein JW795_13655 [Chitinivibrionales bacterium]|nr:hypothetical protein [Chitinivibrionales bacterium]